MGRISTRHYPALVREIETWRQDGLITEETASALAERYSRAGEPKLAGALTMIGAILVGLGVITFVGANWSAMTAMAKVFVLLAGIATSYLLGWRFQYEPGNRPKLGAAMSMLGSLLFGASIWLLGQTFNLDPSVEDGTFLWALGLLPLVAITRSPAQGTLFSIITTIWMFSHDPNTFPTIFWGIAGMTASFGVSHYIRSRAALIVSLIGGAAWFTMVTSTWVGIVAFGLASFGAFLFYKRRWVLMADPYMYAGAIATLGGLLIATLGHDSVEIRQGGVGISLVLISLVVPVVVALLDRKSMPDVAGLLLILLGTCGLMNLKDLPLAALSNVMCLGAIVVAVWAGLNRYRRPALINIALVFFVLEIIARYFDFFFKMMDKSLFFLVGGIFLLVIGSIAERSRRKLIERIA